MADPSAAPETAVQPPPGFKLITPPTDEVKPPAGFKLVTSSAEPTTPPAVAADDEQPSLAARVAQAHPVSNVLMNVVPPVANALVADPIRNLAADVVGGVRSPPIGEAGREGFYTERDKSLEASSGLRLPQTETGDKIASVLGLPGQAISGLVGALGDMTGTRETLGPAATIGGDVLPLAGGLAGALRGRAGVPAAMQPRPAAVAARDAGYKLSPEYISEDPGLASHLMSGEAGRIKKHQSFSQDNQANTNSLAARSIGLAPDTTLNAGAFNRARAPAVAAYDAIRNEIPDTVLGADPTFRAAVDGVGVRSAEVERAFPEVANNPAIAELRQQLLQNGVASTDAVIRKIADLRADGGRNFRKRDDPQSHALGYAQRQAADVLEDAIERSIGYGPARSAAFAARDAAVHEVVRAQAALDGQRVQSIGMPAARAALATADADLAAALRTVTPAETARATAMRERFQAARQLFARTYDVEAATNMATGDVLARRIAAQRSTRRRPLGGELRQIADSYDAHPRDMQSPASYGYTEDYSVLDVIGGLSAAAAGHPMVAGAIAGRGPTRALLRSEPVQRHIFNRHPAVSSAGSGVAAGEALMPHEDDGVARMFGR